MVSMVECITNVLSQVAGGMSRYTLSDPNETLRKFDLISLGHLSLIPCHVTILSLAITIAMLYNSQLHSKF